MGKLLYSLLLTLCRKVGFILLLINSPIQQFLWYEMKYTY